MNAFRAILISTLLLPAGALQAQITIELDDLQLEAGARKSFLTHQANLSVVDGLILEPGGPFHWDFSEGVSDETYESGASIG